MPWGPDSARTAPLPDGWAATRRRILARDRHRCQWAPLGTCHQRATEVDHINNPDDHADSNLRSLCADHHAEKTSAQGNRARWRHTRRRPVERHPGILD